MPRRADHITAIGHMVEDMELRMRNFLDQIYFGKTKDVTSEVRSIGSLSESEDRAALQRNLIMGLRKAQGQ